MSYSLFLDDDRLPERVTWVALPPDSKWVIVRDYDSFVKAILERGLPEFVTFDNDLCDAHYQEFFAAVRGNRWYNYEATSTKTGFHAAMWMKDFCLKNNLKIPPFEVHSKNDFARHDIREFLTIP